MNLQDRIDPTVEPTAPVGGSWESEFDEKFTIVEIGDHTCEGWNDLGDDMMDKAYLASPEKIKAFIRQTIKNREREIAALIDDLSPKLMRQNHELRGAEMAGWINCKSAILDALINKQ